MLPIPLQLVDNFLLKINLGDVILVGFIFGTLGVALKKSRRLLVLHFITFGALLLLGPVILYSTDPDYALLTEPFHYKMIGLALLVVSPVLYTTAQK